MDGALSQDEINALLSGMDLSEDDESGTVGSSKGGNENAEGAVQSMEEANELLSDVEKDAVGEVANISMGSSATTLYSLVSRKVNITTPVVEFATWDDLLNQYERPCVFIQIKYTVGLDGTNILILKEQDVKVITDLMMGGDGTNTDGELGELHLSAISEAMNQMMGASATSLSTMMKTKIDISPPEAELLDLAQVRNGEDISPFLKGIFVKISFRMQIDDLVDSSIMQLYPIDFARKVVDTFMDSQSAAQEKPPVQETAPTNTAASAPAGANPQAAMAQTDMNGQAGTNMGMPTGMGVNPQMDMNAANMGMNPQMMGMNPQMMGMNPQMMGMGMGMNPQMMNMGMNPQMMGMGVPAGTGQQAPMQNINVQPAQFQSFANVGGAVPGQENIGLIMDVPLNVTVELGRTTKSISEILDFAPGSIIELERIAGEPIDVLVNGKFVAKGEVVVIEECFSVRITEIIK